MGIGVTDAIDVSSNGRTEGDVDVDDAERALCEIEAEYLRARRTTAARRSPHPRELTCGYCGKFWRPFAGTTLDGHTACVVTPRFRQTLYRLSRPHATLTMRRIGERLSVKVWIVMRWYERAAQREIQGAAGSARTGPPGPPESTGGKT